MTCLWKVDVGSPEIVFFNELNCGKYRLYFNFPKITGYFQSRKRVQLWSYLSQPTK